MSGAIHYVKDFDGVSLAELADRFGTPLYIYSHSNLQEKFKRLTGALHGVPHTICYAVKANSNLTILNEFNKLGAGFDTVSGGEIKRVLKVGADPKKIVFSGVGKSATEIKEAIASGVGSINVESAEELLLLGEIAATLKTGANVSIRLNPDIAISSHPHLITGLRTSKFGVSFEDGLAMWESVKNNPYVNLVGLACHIGSGIHELQPLEQAYLKLLEGAQLFTERGASINKIDFGGGFGISYSGHYKGLDIAAFGQMVSRVISGTPYEYVVEPGKYLIGEAGVLLTRVLYRKSNSSKTFLIVDCGMNDLMRPALYDAFHQIDVVGELEKLAPSPATLYDIVGPVCESACYLARERELPAGVKRDDLLLVRDAGAYGFSMASRYNSRPLAAEVIVADGKATIMRKRECYEDLWANETIEII